MLTSFRGNTVWKDIVVNLQARKCFSHSQYATKVHSTLYVFSDRLSVPLLCIWVLVKI